MRGWSYRLQFYDIGLRGLIFDFVYLCFMQKIVVNLGLKRISLWVLMMVCAGIAISACGSPKGHVKAKNTGCNCGF